MQPPPDLSLLGSANSGSSADLSGGVIIQSRLPETCQVPTIDRFQKIDSDGPVPVDPSEMLRDHGLQVTSQRLAVLDAVSANAHCSAADLAETVREQIGAISQQSVYDTLTVLSDHGIIRRIQPAGSPARYETRVGDNHHHLVCTTCGRLVDVDCATGNTPCLSPAQNWDYEIHEAEVIYWGICPGCKASTE